ncbi:tetratricopeptide repeat protein [Bacteroides sp. 51]|uniref:tetratricopeptide repeat protein n=1 Tax=Bacteroides sp. 51 TaxID=2302938 RepID=UPI0013D0FA75|nr:tetratricopeptide repeat protein [Bacteroides sp. 51]NDV82095.1 tetratricopeptide repeat protein [Bacteroides sp. 51]
MKTRILRLICFYICCFPLIVSAQVNRTGTSSGNLYNEARELFTQKHYAAAAPLLRTFLTQKPSAGLRLEAEYMLACSAYELQDQRRIEILKTYLKNFPDSPYTNRVNSLIASAYFFEKDYDNALAMFNSVDPDLLPNDERDDIVYRMAISNMTVGNVDQAAAWFEVLKNNSKKYAKDCAYYISYIRYTQGRYDEALSGFLPLQDDSKYKTLVPYYIAECYLQKKQYDQAETIAQKFLSAHPRDPNAGELFRVLGEVYYNLQEYDKAVTSFESYKSAIDPPRRDALYMLGLSYYKTGVYSKATVALGEVITLDDALTQNAYLHLGLSYLQLAEKTKARMAFEQAAASNADMRVKEQAAYNYALSVHDTSFSAFGESVTAFEKFLNEFPNSEYAEKISGYLVDVYLNTKSYEAALSSIDRISRPTTRIMEAKQKILFQLGTQAFVNTAFDKAVSYFNESIALGQYNAQTQADAYYWRGEAYYRQNAVDNASRDFNEYLRLTTQKNTEMYALAHYNLGYVAFHKKNYPQARDWFKKYISLDKGRNRTALADAYNRVGDSYLNERDFDNAKHAYSQAEAMDTPAGDYSFYQLALVSGLQKDYAGKITLLNRLAGKYPSSAYIVNALYEKGRSYVLMENNSQAITAFRELLDKYPNSPVSRKAAAEIGMLYYQNENYDQAIAAYKYVVENYPGSEEARLALRDLKSIYIDANRVDEFAALASSLPGNIQFDTNEQDSLTYVAAEKIYMRGRIEEAKSSLTKYLQSFPDGAFGLNAYYYLTLIAKEQGQSNLVLEYSEKLLEYPNNQFSEEVLIMRSEVQFNAQQYANALVTYKQLKEKASTVDRRILAETGILRSAYMSRNDMETIHAATDLLSEAKLTPELTQEAMYFRARAYLNQNASEAAMRDLQTLAEDTRNSYGAEAKYLVAREYYEAKDYTAAEKEILDFIDKSTPHAYWLARGFILLSDTYVAMGRELDARQYLLSLQQNYQADDDIKSMIDTRLQKLK